MKFLKKLFLALFTLLSANVQANVCSNYYYDERGRVTLGCSYRQDSITYELRDVFGVEVEQEFDPLRIFQIGGRGNYLWGNFYLRGAANLGWIVSGDTYKNSYIGDLDLLAHKGTVEGFNVYDLSGGIGYEFKIDWLKFTPLVGYSWSQQVIKTSQLCIERDFMNDIRIGTRIAGLRESLVLNWLGPWVGIDLLYAGYKCWDFYACFEYHWAEISGTYETTRAVVDEITFYKLERHERGCGQGFVGMAGFMFDICYCWKGMLLGSYQAWNLDHGYGRDEDGDLLEIKKLNWNTWSVTLGLNWVY